MPYIYQREMTITHADFFRLLPRALGTPDFTRTGQTVTLKQPGRSVQIRLSDETAWKIGALSLPKTQVEICVSDCSEAESLKIIQAFDRSYQKGGG